MNPIVEREKGLLELEQRIADLKAHAAEQPVDLGRDPRARSQVHGNPARDLRSPHAVAAGQHGPPSATAAGLGYYRGARPVRRAPRRPSLRRRSGDHRRLREARGRRIIAIAQDKGATLKKRCTATSACRGPRDIARCSGLVRLAAASRAADRDVRRYVGRRSGHRFRRTRAIRGDRAVARRFAEAPMPIVATVIGEGGSGGALALALADHVRCWSTPSTRSLPPRAARRSCGATPAKRKKPPRGCD